MTQKNSKLLMKNRLYNKLLNRGADREQRKNKYKVILNNLH